MADTPVVLVFALGLSGGGCALWGCQKSARPVSCSDDQGQSYGIMTICVVWVPEIMSRYATCAYEGFR
jgi:hypothetical protein